MLWYSLEALQRGVFNEDPQPYVFVREEIKKNIYRIQPNYCTVHLGFSKMLW